MILVPVGRPDLERVWTVAEPFLARACMRPGCNLTIGALHALLTADEAQLILLLDGSRAVAAGVTQVRQHRDGRLACWALTLGGSAAGPWRHVIDAIEAGARRVGCASLEFVGRPAWHRLFPDFDARPDPVGFHFSKALAAS